MEEVLVVLLQVLFELVLQAASYAGMGWAWDWGRDETDMGCGYIPLFLILGMLVGGLVNLVHPGLVTPWPVLRLLGLIVWPVTAACLAWLITGALRKRGKRVDVTGHAASAFCFVLGFNVVRFIFGVKC